MLAIEVILQSSLASSYLKATDPAELEVLAAARQNQMPIGFIPQLLARGLIWFGHLFLRLDTFFEI